MHLTPLVWREQCRTNPAALLSAILSFKFVFFFFKNFPDFLGKLSVTVLTVFVTMICQFYQMNGITELTCRSTRLKQSLCLTFRHITLCLYVFLYYYSLFNIHKIKSSSHSIYSSAILTVICRSSHIVEEDTVCSKLCIVMIICLNENTPTGDVLYKLGSQLITNNIISQLIP